MKYRTIGTNPTTRREVSVLALGAMLFGSVTDEATSFALLDRYVEAGGNFIDTSDNYAFWADGGQGGQSEELLGRWRRSRGVGDEIVIATKLGARPLAAAAGLPGYEVLQYAHTHLRPRSDVPDALFPDGSLGHAGPDLLGYLRAEPGLTLVAYSPLLKGAYTRPERLPADFDHPGTPARLAVLRDVARETGATVNQVVLAWQIGGETPVLPLAGVSTVAQLEENLAAVDLELTPEQRARLDAAH